MRIIAMVMLLLFVGCAASASVAVRCEGEAFLLGEDGTEIAAPGVYTDIACLGGDRFAACLNERYALMNAEGERLTDNIYTDLEVCGDLIRAGADGYYAVLDMNGNALSSMIYSKIVFGQDRYAWALRGDGDQLWILTEAGAAYAPCGEIDSIADCSGDGLLAVKLADSRLWGYCDRNGRLVIEDLYDHADPYSEGLARVVSDGRYGVIDASGDRVIPFRYDSLEITERFIIAAIGTAVTVFDRNGEVTARYEGAVNGFAAFKERYAIYEAERVTLYTADGDALGEYSADTQLREGINGGIIIDDGDWGECRERLFGAEEMCRLSISPLGTANGSAVYRGGTADVSTVWDSVLDEDRYRVDTDSLRYFVITETGTEANAGEWYAIDYLEDDRFWVEGEDAFRMIDSEGTIYYTYEKKVS